MKRYRRGVTLVEVSLFLAITAAVFVSIAVGTQNSIFQQRYNDSVQNFVEFLRTVYSQVNNVQSEGNGRSERAIYGKLVVFGEESTEGEARRNLITSYNVIGDIGNAGGGSVLEQLKKLNARVYEEKDGVKTMVGYAEEYTPRWASQIQTTDGWDDGYELFRGALLIVRHPSSGTVYTFRTEGEINVEEVLSLDDFASGDIDFCVNPNGADRSSLRRDVRIISGARNASGIEIIPDEQEEVNGVNVGNRCE